MKVLEGEKGYRCPGCDRTDVKKGSRHKRRDEWCDGVRSERQKAYDAALEQVMKVYELYEQAFDMLWNVDDYGPCMTFCKQALDACARAGIRVGERRGIRG